MTERADKRRNARLVLSYPIAVTRDGLPEEEPRSVASRPTKTVTRNLGARGAYFATLDGAAYSVGQSVSVVLSVPHRLAAGGAEVTLDLCGRGRVVRVDGPLVHRLFGEDGPTVCGIALSFEGPLTFSYRWI